MLSTDTEEIVADATRYAAEHGITLQRNNFKMIDGEPTLDGMLPDDWVAAMTMD